MAKQGQVQVENQPHPPAHRQGLYSWLQRIHPHIGPWWWWPRWLSQHQFSTDT
jgi:hypothetical protein